MNSKNSRAVAGLMAAVLAVGLVSVVGSSASAVASSPDPRTAPIYNSMEEPAPASHPSWGYTARSTREMGDLIEFGGISREVESVTIGMNNWACQTGSGASCLTAPGTSFDEPITVHFYEVGDDGAVGDKITSITETFAIPFRPSADPSHCGDTRWYDEDRDTCQNGMTVPITFDLTDTTLTLSDQVIVSITYPTSRFGELERGPWDSLNLDTVSGAPYVGTDLDPDVMYVDSDWASAYNGGPTGVFRATTNYTGTALNMKIEAKPASALVKTGTIRGDFENKKSIVNGVNVAQLSNFAPAAGCYYGTAPVTNYSTHGTKGFINTKYAGYANGFPKNGYSASADFYLGADAANGQFTWSHAVNNTKGDHRRDFVFVAGANGSGKWTVGASTGVNTSGNTAYGEAPISVTKSGWYTFRHTLYAGAHNLLYVDLDVLNAAGNVVGSWTLGGEAGDSIPGVVGGNRYGWLVTNTYAGLPIDNVLLGVERPAAGCTPFLDVSGVNASSKYSSHSHAIAWMGVTGLSNGWKTTGGSVFRPQANTDRDAMAAFFYRAAGSPAVKTKKSPFIDVSSSPSSKHYNTHWKAIFWMQENGYSNGWKTKSGAKFSPHADISRAHVAAFIYRINGSPAVKTSGAFSDVSGDSRSSKYSNFAKEIQWLHETGLSNGWETKSGAQFRPNSAIKRDAIAAFIFRAEFNLDK